MKVRALVCAVAAALPFAALSQNADHASGRGRKYKAPPPISHIEVTVTRANSGKPVENAAVIFHTVHDGKDQGNMELKTNEDGKAVLDLIPLGDEVHIQVFKSGFQTYGETFTNDQTARTFDIKVKPPSGQYSTYKAGPLESSGQQSVTPQPTQGSSKPSGPGH